MHLPAITIIMCNYNYGRFIKEAINSVMQQEYTNFELIIVDDSSIDNSWDIIQSCQKAYPDKIIAFRRKKNEGQAAGFNLAFSKARGEIVSFIDSDDVWLPGKLTYVVETFNIRKDIAICQHGLRFIQDDVKKELELDTVLYNGNYFEFTQKNRQLPRFVPTCGLSFSKKVLEKIFPIPPEFKTCADGYLSRTAFCFGNVYSSPLALAYYRIHGNNAVAGNSDLNLKKYIFDLLIPKLNSFYRKNKIQLRFPRPAKWYTYLNPVFVYKHRQYISPKLYKYFRLRFLDHKVFISRQDRLLHQMHNTYSGGKCFLLGRNIINQDIDLSFLKDEFVIAADCAIMHDQIQLFKKGVYCISDRRVWGDGKGINSDFISAIDRCKELTKCFEISAKPLFDRIKLQETHEILYREVNHKRKLWMGDFEIDIVRELCWGDHVILDMCLPLAFFLGFSEIVLIGCDWDHALQKPIIEKFIKEHAYEPQAILGPDIFPAWNGTSFREDIWQDGFNIIKKIFKENNRLIKKGCSGKFTAKR